MWVTEEKHLQGPNPQTPHGVPSHDIINCAVCSWLVPFSQREKRWCFRKGLRAIRRDSWSTLLQELTNGTSEGCTGVPRLCSETRENLKPFIRAHAASISRQVEKKNNMEQEKKINLYPEHLINKKGVGGTVDPAVFSECFCLYGKLLKCFSV